MSSNDGSQTLTTAADVGAAQIVSKFSEPFDLAALFSLTDKAVLDNDEGEEEIVEGAPMEGIDVDAGMDIMQDEPVLENTYAQYSPLHLNLPDIL
jgi:hypothetical protein